MGLEALLGIKTVAEIAREYQVHPTQVSQWKGAIVERLPEVFEHGATAQAGLARRGEGATGLDVKTLRAAVLLAVGFVGSFLTARSGDAQNSPPRPQPKSPAAGHLRFFRQSLRILGDFMYNPFKRSSRRIFRGFGGLRREIVRRL